MKATWGLRLEIMKKNMRNNESNIWSKTGNGENNTWAVTGTNKSNMSRLIDGWLIVWCLTPFSAVFELYHSSQCIYTCFRRVLVTNQCSALYSFQATGCLPTKLMSEQGTVVREEWILSQLLKSIPVRNIGRDRTSDLFSSPVCYQLRFWAQRLGLGILKATWSWTRKCGNMRFNSFPKHALVFTCLQYKSFENTGGKGEIARKEQFLLFPVFPIYLGNFPSFSSNLKLLSANSFNLDGSKICHLGKG